MKSQVIQTSVNVLEPRKKKKTKFNFFYIKVKNLTLLFPLSKKKKSWTGIL